jgi:hypothetical protein
MTLLTAQDAVTAANLDPDLKYAFYYANGPYANEAEVRARCPHATLVPIMVHSGPLVKNSMCDSETLDFTVPETETWVVDMLNAGEYRPRVYANLDRWENVGLLAGLAKYGTEIRRAVADYTITSTAALPTAIPWDWCDGWQCSTNGVDRWVCRDDFFDMVAPAPKPTPKPPAPPVDPHYDYFDATRIKLPRGTNSERNVVENYDKQRLDEAKNYASLLAIRKNLTFLHTRAVNNLKKEGPGNHLEWRIPQLEERAAGKQVVK